MRVLVACEFSDTLASRIRKRGHSVLSCDLLSSEGDGPHYRGDVLDIINDGWDALVGFPPCFRLCNSGVRWLHERNLWREMEEAALFFKKLLNSKIEKIAIENPIPHKYAIEIIGTKYSQIVQPWMFGHGETKATCLWLKGFKKLKPTNIVSGRADRIHRIPPGPDRWKERSRTFPGIADAMAEQWF